MDEKQKPLCLLVIGEGATPEAAEEFLRMMGRCIYLSTASASGRLVLAAFALPESKRWWLEGLAETPELVGLERVQLTPYLSTLLSSPWSRGEVIAAGEPPCGAHCPTCPSYGAPCPGCAGSRFCRAGVRGEAMPAAVS